MVFLQHCHGWFVLFASVPRLKLPTMTKDVPLMKLVYLVFTRIPHRFPWATQVFVIVFVKRSLFILHVVPTTFRCLILRKLDLHNVSSLNLELDKMHQLMLCHSYDVILPSSKMILTILPPPTPATPPPYTHTHTAFSPLL